MSDTNQLATVQFNRDQVETIKKTLMPEGSSDGEMQLFLEYCKRTQLDPFARQIYATKIGGKLSIQSSIDGFRLIAERSGKYGGQTIPQYLNSKGDWVEVWTDTGFPVACKVGIIRKDFDQPLYGIAKWSSYCPMQGGKPGFMWAKMPEVMLAKVAEALALRKAFPNDLSGIYSAEEMEQAGPEKKTPRSVDSNVASPSKPTVVEPVEPTMITDEKFKLTLDEVETVNDVARLEARIPKISAIKTMTEDQKTQLIAKHEEQIAKLKTPKEVKVEEGEASPEQLATIQA